MKVVSKLRSGEDINRLDGFYKRVSAKCNRYQKGREHRKNRGVISETRKNVFAGSSKVYTSMQRPEIIFLGQTEYSPRFNQYYYYNTLLEVGFGAEVKYPYLPYEAQLIQHDLVRPEDYSRQGSLTHILENTETIFANVPRDLESEVDQGYPTAHFRFFEFTKTKDLRELAGYAPGFLRNHDPAHYTCLVRSLRRRRKAERAKAEKKERQEIYRFLLENPTIDLV